MNFQSILKMFIPNGIEKSIVHWEDVYAAVIAIAIIIFWLSLLDCLMEKFEGRGILIFICLVIAENILTNHEGTICNCRSNICFVMTNTSVSSEATAVAFR